MISLATTIPGSSDNGYVAAAYIVFFAIVLIYVAIMALRLSRVERGLRELAERAEHPPQDELSATGGRQQEEARGQTQRERTLQGTGETA
jgi:hypothetical protein